jgi:hypothetical protein
MNKSKKPVKKFSMDGLRPPTKKTAGKSKGKKSAC